MAASLPQKAEWIPNLLSRFGARTSRVAEGYAEVVRGLHPPA
jgi:hypothetical protein